MAESQPATDSDPIQLASELRPLLARNAAQAERDRRLPTENVEAIEAANLFKVITPKRWHGYGVPLATSLNVWAEMAKGCASSGWVTMIIGVSLWAASLLPDAGQEEIFGSPTLRICGLISPKLRAQRVDGGLRISGSSPFASGCWHSSWALLGCMVEDSDHNIVDQAVGFAPISELDIEDTWFVAGMSGTGSNTLIARDVFVPNHRTLSVSRALNGVYPHRRYSGEPSDRYAFAPVLALVLIAPVLGIAKSLLEEIVEGARSRGITFTTYTRQADAPVLQRQVAEAALKIDSAWLHAMRAAADIHEAAVAGNHMDYVGRARVHADCGYAGQLVREATDALMSVGGASAFAQSSPLQRMWRDANVAARHAMLATGRNLEMYGRALLGVEGNITPFI